jgi:putative OPT family oligopeptide transporter
MYSIPLRRALVTHSDLPYPEGVACAEVLKVGASEEGENVSAAESSRAGLMAIVAGSVVSAVFAIVVTTQIFASDVIQYFRVGNKGAATGYDFSLSFALFAVGHLVGLWVGVAMLLGFLIAWGGAVPYMTMLHVVAGTASDVAQGAWSHQVRFIGAGAIGAAAIWTLAKLIKPVVNGLAAAMAASRIRASGQGGTLPITERDIPIGLVGIISLICLAPIAWLLADFSVASGLGAHTVALVVGGLVYIVVMSFFVSAVCGYMAGLIGSSNSPLSGVGILVVIGAALLLVVGIKPLMGASAGPALVAFALFATAVIFAVATIANNNLQDLKTGQLVGATPWKQQVALVIGVLAGAAVIPPVLDLLNHAYGFAGAAGVDPSRALAAPQAALISALAQGVIQGNLDWSLIGIGALIGVATIVLDEVLGITTTSVRIPPLAVGLGIYLPSQTTLMIVVGAFVGWWFDKRAERTPKPEATKQLGVLLASGMIVGESLVGVLGAGIVVYANNPAALALVGPGFAPYAVWIGGFVFAASMIVLYSWLGRVSRKG